MFFWAELLWREWSELGDPDSELFIIDIWIIAMDYAREPVVRIERDLGLSYNSC